MRPARERPAAAFAAHSPGALGALLILGVLLLAAGCSGGGEPAGEGSPPRRPTIRIASFDFPESTVLAEVYAAALQAGRYPVRRIGGLGSREVVLPALEQGHVDLVPEYAGSALRFLTGTDASGLPGTETARRLRAAFARRGVHVLAFAPAEDQNAFVVTAETARRHGLRQVSDLRGVAETLRFGGPPECPNRPYCLLGLRDRYGLSFRRFVPMASRALTAEALRDREIDIGMIETTNAHLGEDLVVLADDRRLQPAENVVPVVAGRIVAAYGEQIVALLNSVSARLTTGDLAALNRRVEVGGDDVTDVAREWLRRLPA